MRIRLKYEKGEQVKYLGHLDNMKVFTRCIKRTNLPIKYSGGFNPRVQLTFALPLGVGVTSSCEYMELELSEKVDEKIVIEEINKCLPPSIKILDAKYSEDTKSLMSLVREAIYEIRIECLKNSIGEIKELFKKPEIIVQKQTKTNPKGEDVNIKPYILDLEFEEINNNIKAILHCTAGSTNNLNPYLIIEAINKYLPDIHVEDYDIHRKELIIDR
jgi:radical SAM-linked protein